MHLEIGVDRTSSLEIRLPRRLVDEQSVAAVDKEGRQLKVRIEFVAGLHQYLPDSRRVEPICPGRGSRGRMSWAVISLGRFGGSRYASTGWTVSHCQWTMSAARAWWR